MAPSLGFGLCILTPESDRRDRPSVGPFVVGLSARGPRQEGQVQDGPGVSLPA